MKVADAVASDDKYDPYYFEDEHAQLIADQGKRIEDLETLECKYVDGAYMFRSGKCPGLRAGHKDYKVAHKEAIRQLETLTK